jgi:hypothetical protein
MADITNKNQNLGYDDFVKFNSNFGAGRRRDFNSSVVGPNISSTDRVIGVRDPGLGRDFDTIDPVTKAPPNAPAAPTGNTGYTFTGLAEALNSYQNELAKKYKAEGYIADIYEFVFDPKAQGLGAKKVKNPGSTDRSKTAGKNVTTARQALDSNTVPVNNNSQNWSIQAGTQIVQLIDQIMRGSDYIREQANTTVNAVTQKPESNPGTGTGMVTWYNITVQATSLGHDTKRNDFAYRMKFLITPYAISKMASEYFPDSKYRGSHKSYNYWFTGQNSQILSFEQKYDALYRLIISGEGVAQQQTMITTKYRDQYTKTPMPTTTQKTGQQTGTYTNQASDSAADFLYSPTDFSQAKVRIVGDPAWMQQGTIVTGVSDLSFSFNPFNADGSINYDSQMVNFDINWNQPQDYDFSTGVMNVNDTQGRPRTNNTYIATECRSFFSKGRFEQEIEGRLLIENKPNQVVATSEQVARPAAKKPFVPPQGFVGPPKEPDGRVIGLGGGAAIVAPNGVRRPEIGRGDGVLPESLAERAQRANEYRNSRPF